MSVIAPPPLRPQWLSVLAHADRDTLAACVPVLDDVTFDLLRAPEVGLAMVQARVSNQGARFNLGEVTMTRCVVRCTDTTAAPEQGRRIGLGYVLGRDTVRAEHIARLDALLQLPRWHDRLMREVITVLQDQTAQRHRTEAERTRASRVDFYTLAPDRT